MSQEIKHLFRKKPSLELVHDILTSLHFTGITDARIFSKHDISVSIFEEWLPMLEPYYLPCKAREKVNQGTKQTLYQFEREIWGDLSGSLSVEFT
jgi:hypothetical protein